MKVHELAPSPGATTSRKRVGRGIAGKGGKTAGHGTKGQKARGRGKVRVGFEGGQMPLKQRVPKLKGFTNPFRVEYSAVNLDTLDELADRLDGPDGIRVTPESLAAAGAVRSGVFVKVLARGATAGTFNRKLDVAVHAVSKAAERAIVDAGGSVTILPLPFQGENKAGRPAARGNQFTNR